eukprot:gene30127-37199_t
MMNNEYFLFKAMLFMATPLHGFEVDFINSVQFSNHTGYQNGFNGISLNNNDLLKLYDGLKK